MRAAVYDRTGPARDVLRIVELPTPIPGPGEVRVKLAWSGVNPSDVKTRGGVRTTTLPFPQIVPHSDGAGVIDVVGEHVAPARVGEPVWVWNAAWGRPYGTAAEYVVLPEQQAVPLPAGVDPAIGACLGIPALTAYHAVAVDGGVANKRVLVAGGAGAVGQYAVQFAKLHGPTSIIATISSAAKAALATAAGADHVVNYKTDDLAACVLAATDGHGIDRIIEVDGGVNMAQDLALLHPEGDIVVYGSSAAAVTVPFMPAITKNVRVRFFIVYNLAPAARARAITEVTALLAMHRLTHTIGARLPLARIVEAHELVEQGQVVGNVVLAIAD